MHQRSRTTHRGRIGRATALVAAATITAGLAGCEPATTVLDVVYRDGGGGTVSYTVECGPDLASITPAIAGLDADRACAVVAAETALLTQGPPAGRICAQQYHGPQQAQVTGHVDDASVALALRRNNGCVESDWRRLTGLVIRPASR
ncbi:MAG TPA: hypothetical protein VK507_20665 [Iamia sp.]|nr:hypothetical protein [Iamia sp.]